MSRLILSVSALALVVAASSNLNAAAHQNKAGTEISKDPQNNIRGDGIDLMAKPAASEAKGPGLEISGGSSFNAYSFNNRVRGSKGRGSHFGVDSSRINFEVSGKTDHRLDCLEYSFLIGLTGNTEANQTSVEENRVKLKHRFGTFMGGVHRGVTDFMSVGSFLFYGATGGVVGNWTNVAALTTGAVVKDDPAGHGKDRTKITLVTPRFVLAPGFGGFQIGYSFTPDGEHSGEAKVNTLTDGSSTIKPQGQSLNEVAINFKGEAANGFGLQLSAIGLFGNAKMITSEDTAIASNRHYNDIRSYAFGAVVSYNGFSLGGEYLNNTNSLAIDSYTMGGQNYAIDCAGAGRIWNVGLGYSHDRHTFSLGYLRSDRNLGQERNIATNVLGTDFGTVRSDVASFTYDYKVAKGLKVYAEATSYDMQNSNDTNAALWANRALNNTSPVESNNGRSFLVGTAISF